MLDVLEVLLEAKCGKERENEITIMLVATKFSCLQLITNRFAQNNCEKEKYKMSSVISFHIKTTNFKTIEAMLVFSSQNSAQNI